MKYIAKSTVTITLAVVLMICAMSALADGLRAEVQEISDSPEWVINLPTAQNAHQLFVVAGIGMDKTTATVSMHQRDEEGNWKQILSTPGYVGKNGMCLDEDHAEGCAQTPVGIYHFNRAFGIAADPGCAIPYVQVDDDTYWSGDSDYHYNEMININDYPELAMDDSEHIVDYDYQYQYCLNISFNEEGAPGRGSAIFLHCLGSTKPWIGGCVAIPEYIMKQVMQNVREDCIVVIDNMQRSVDMKQRFTADRAGVGQAIEHIRRVLQDRHIKNSEIERTVLTAEEAMGELFAHAKEGGSLHVVSHTFLGTTSFELSTDGEAFDYQESLASPMFISMCNCLGDVVITTVVAKSEKLIDVKKTGMKSYAILTL